MRRLSRNLVVVVATASMVGALGLVGAGQVAALQATPIVSPDPVAPGQQFTVSGEADCTSDSTLTVAVPDLGLSQQVSGDTAWQAPFTVPVDAVPDHYLVTVDGGECTFPDTGFDVALVESISLVKTVGTTPGVCASTSSISVEAGTTVYYCYTMTNNTQSTLSVHDLTDDKLGTILSSFSTNLAPGASTNTVTLGKAVSTTVTATTTNTATWTAHTQPGIPFTATASATVTVATATTTTSSAAQPLAIVPAFTG